MNSECVKNARKEKIIYQIRPRFLHPDNPPHCALTVPHRAAYPRPL